MGILTDAKRRLEKTGFTMREVLSGEHEFEPEFGPPGRRNMEFDVTWGPASVAEWATAASRKFGLMDLEGTVTVDGLCANAPCKGTLALRYFSDRKIRYTFEFGAEGKRYRFVGEKVNIRPWNLPVSHTTCFGRVTEADSGKLVCTSVLFFRMSTMPQFLLSFRKKSR